MNSLLKHKSVLVVGGTKGLGGAIVDALGDAGAKVTFSGRSNSPPHKGEFIQSDMQTIHGTKLLAEKLKGRDFDTALLSVGIFSKRHVERNAEGVQMDLAVSYLSRFVLMQEFGNNPQAFPKLKRVFILGFPGQNNTITDIEDINFERTPYKQLPAHTNAVVLNECLVYEAQRKFPNLQIFGLNPGLIETGENNEGSWFDWMLEKSIGLFSMSPRTFAETSVLPLLVNDKLGSPASFSRKGKVLPSVGWAASEENQRRAWEVSQQLVDKVMKQ